ncbi:MAG: hypothetical protein K2H23_04800 [Oscillospiraceae bacterium]|nr:hypothetical protein [Oscillospiraceae bacterium]
MKKSVKSVTLKSAAEETMDKKTKNIVIGVCIVLFVFLAIFAAYAGTRIGADIGEFIYNIKH